jgi:hypothetical protein
MTVIPGGHRLTGGDADFSSRENVGNGEEIPIPGNTRR